MLATEQCSVSTVYQVLYTVYLRCCCLLRACLFHDDSVLNRAKLSYHFKVGSIQPLLPTLGRLQITALKIQEQSTTSTPDPGILRTGSTADCWTVAVVANLVKLQLHFKVSSARLPLSPLQRLHLLRCRYRRYTCCCKPRHVLAAVCMIRCPLCMRTPASKLAHHPTPRHVRHKVYRRRLLLYYRLNLQQKPLTLSRNSSSWW